MIFNVTITTLVRVEENRKSEIYTQNDLLIYSNIWIWKSWFGNLYWTRTKIFFDYWFI